MSESCGCPYSGMTAEKLSSFDENELVTLAVKMIPIFLKSEKYEEIIRIAALLPSPNGMKKILENNEQELALGTKKPFENLRDTVNAIRVSLRQMIIGEPYKCSLETIEALSIVANKHSNKKTEYWAMELLKILSDEKKLGGQINSWFSYFEEIKKLIEVFNLPEENVKEIFRKVLKENEKLKHVSFWTYNFSKIKDIVNTFNLSWEEFREVSIKIIEENKKELPDDCMELAKIVIFHLDLKELQKTADELLIKANEADNSERRKDLTSIACGTYRKLEDEFRVGGRERILKAFEGPKITGRKSVNKTIWVASKILGFKYKKQGFWDIGW